MSVPSSIRRSAPLSREEARSLSSAPPAPPSDAPERAYLTFMMIPVEERIGEWRFSGVARSLQEAFLRIADFGREIGMTEHPRESIIADWLEAEALEVWTDVSKAWSYDALPLEEIGDHDVVLFAEGQAPYDDFGFAVLEIATLEGSPFKERVPDTSRPTGASEEEDLDEEEGVIDDE
ncbi:MAG: hypothetical protein U0441_21585 [Polyangiaceae bacterium]